MTTPTKEQINNLWKRLIEINKIDMQPGDVDQNAANSMAKLDLMAEEPVIKSFQAACTDGTEMPQCPENNIFFKNVVMEDPSLGYPSSILGADVNDRATNAKKDLAALEGAQANIEKKDPIAPGRPSGATHYVNLPPGEENSFAILRAGFVSSNTNLVTGGLKNLDIKKGKKYLIKKSLFGSKFRNKNYSSSGEIVEELPNKTPIMLIREGYGKNATFSQVAVWDSEFEEWRYLRSVEAAASVTQIYDIAFIDRRVLKRYSESNFVELPLVEVSDSDPNYRFIKWDQREQCRPVLNKRTNEYELTYRAEISGLQSLMENAEDIADVRREGTQFLLEYYDKKFDSETLDRLMTAGGANFSHNPRRGGEGSTLYYGDEPPIHIGLFATVKRFSPWTISSKIESGDPFVASTPEAQAAIDENPNEDRKFTLFQIAIPACYLHHPSLEPDRTKLITRDEYVEKGLVKYQYTFQTDQLDKKIQTLTRDLNIFKQRIDNFEGSITLKPAALDLKIARINKFKIDFDNFLTLNDRAPFLKAEVEIGLDESFKVVFVTYRLDNEKESQYLRVGLNCINKTVAIFEDITASAYMFYSEPIDQAIRKADPEAYPGIELVQKFTVPIPEIFPSKKTSAADDAKNIKPEPAAQKERLKSLEKKSSKTKKEIQEENSLLNTSTRKSNKLKEAKRLTFPTGDQVFTSLNRLIYSSNLSNDVFGNILDTTPVKSLLARYSNCLIASIGANIDPKILEAYNALAITTELFFDLKEQAEGKDLSQIGFELPRLTYSDDPLRDFALSIKAEIQIKLNQNLVPVIKNLLQSLVDSCRGLNLNIPLSNDPDSEPNFDQLNPEDFDKLDTLLSLPERPNFPGSSNILDNFDDQKVANLQRIIRKIISENTGIPLSQLALQQFRNLLDLLSSILRPTEICTLLSGEASDRVLTIILTLVQGRSEFSLISEALNTTDSINQTFKTLGEYANLSFCKTFTEDLSLVSLLCERELNKEAYCEALQNQGYTPEECEAILLEQLEDDSEKIVILSEILTAESISDYFQDQVGEAFCSADSTSDFATDNEFINEIANEALQGSVSAVESTINAELIGVPSLFIEENIIAYGEDPQLTGNQSGLRRPPEIGRDYMNQDFPLGIAGTPMEGKLFFVTAYVKGDGSDLINDSMFPDGTGIDDYEVGQPIIENWPYADRTEREVSPSFKESLQALKDIGPVKIDSIINGEYSKIFSITIKELERSLQTEMQGKFLEIFENYNNLEDVEIPQEIQNTLGNLASLVEQVNQSLEDKKVERNLVECKLPSYKYLKSDAAKENNLTPDFVRFIVNKTPLKKDGNKVKTLVLDSLSNVLDEETMNFINFLEANPETSKGEVNLNDNKYSTETLQGYTFAKILSTSLNQASGYPALSTETKTDLEEQFFRLFTFVYAKKQNDILDQCLKSRFLNPEDLDKLLVAPITNEAFGFLACSDHPNINLEDLKKGLFDFGDTLQDVKDFYNDIACEGNTRDESEPDPLNDAIRYAMMMIFIKLLIGEVAIRGLFFFSRYNAIETMVDSDIFTTLILSKFRDQSENSIIDQTLIADIEEIAYKKLLGNVSGTGIETFLMNEIIYDDSEDPNTRQFTNTKERLFNLHDLTVVREWKEGSPYTAVVEKIIDNALLEDIELDPDETNIINLIKPIAVFYKNKFTTLALKIMINDAAKRIAPRVNSIFLDANRKNVTTSRTLLASDTIFDIPSDVLSLRRAAGRQGGLQGGAGILADYIKNYEEYRSQGIGFQQLFESEMVKAGNAQSLQGLEYSVVDYLYELERLGGDDPRLDLKNICLDAYDHAGKGAANKKFYADSIKSTFYDRHGMPTELGANTKNGGFILQKYVKFEFREWQNYRDTYETSTGLKANLPEDKFTLLIKEIKKEFFILAQSEVDDESNVLASLNEYTVSYKQFDWILDKAGKIIGNYPQEWDYDIKEIFEYIRHGVRLMYVMPHNIGDETGQISEPVKNTYGRFIEVIGKRPAIGSLPITVPLEEGEKLSTLDQIEFLLSMYQRSPKAQRELRAKLFSQKIYQIREPVNAILETQEAVEAKLDPETKLKVKFNKETSSKWIDGELEPVVTYDTEVIPKEQGFGDDPGEESDNIPNPKIVIIKDGVVLEPGSTTLKFSKTGLAVLDGDFSINASNRSFIDKFFDVETEGEININTLFTFKPKALQSFYLLPIAEQEEDITDLELGKQLYDININDIRELTSKNPKFSEISAEGRRAFADEVPIVQKFGVDPQNLVDKLFDQPVVKSLNDYVFSSTNLLNFAVLQQAFFPYREDFDLSDMFASSKQVLNQISESNQEGRDDWSSDITPDVLAGWSEQMDFTMSAQIPTGAYFVWLNTITPKWFLRTYLKSSDPCMKDAFRQQETFGYDDKKLAEIVFGSLFTNPAACADLSNVIGGLGTIGAGIPLPQMNLNLPGNPVDRCLPGIRPTPIFPPGPPPFGFFGNPFRPITPPGLAYIALQFLTGFEDKYSPTPGPEDQQTGASSFDSDICDPNSNLNQDPTLITQEALNEGE